MAYARQQLGKHVTVAMISDKEVVGAYTATQTTR
jgi:hypothetical protein